MKKTPRAIDFIEKFDQEKDTKLIPIMQANILSTHGQVRSNKIIQGVPGQIKQMKGNPFERIAFEPCQCHGNSCQIARATFHEPSDWRCRIRNSLDRSCKSGHIDFGAFLNQIIQVFRVIIQYGKIQRCGQGVALDLDIGALFN